MIDRLARRLAERRGLSDWSLLDEQDRTQFRLDAVAVLTELRQPTERMIRAAYDCCDAFNCADTVTIGDIVSIWSLMAAAALREGVG